MATTDAGVDLESVHYDPDSGTYRVEYDAPSTSASMAVVASLVEVLEVDPTDIPPLYETVDTDAFDRLVDIGDGSSEATRVSFAVEGCTVTASSDGVVTVSPPAEVTPQDRGDQDS